LLAAEKLEMISLCPVRFSWGGGAPDTLDGLTSQELQIVQMAAGGLSNREIGQRLYLSHRTVESHLYRVSRSWGSHRGRSFPVCSAAVVNRTGVLRVLPVPMSDSERAGLRLGPGGTRRHRPVRVLTQRR
jgi:hypothetical protein